MRLLSIETLQLETFISDAAAPPFAILSHTWGPDELTLQDLALPAEALAPRRGWRKITGFRDAVVAHQHLLAGAQPVTHLWVDTVCIDKTSSAELSEAINSMFRWYRAAAACFALLEDVSAADDGEAVGGDFEASRWFTRGWTLQELLAPREVFFFDRNWQCVGSRTTLVSRVSRRTSIAEDVALTGEWPFATVAERMSWASGRQTTRPEDMAYCLLGIFDVNMPMLYGEGEKAFVRLQEEIVKASDDESIFAWDASGGPADGVGVFATHPRQFAQGARIERLPSDSSPFTLTNKGLHITLPIIERQEEPGQEVALLSCSDAADASSVIGLRVRAEPAFSTNYTRLAGPPLVVPLQNHLAFRNAAKAIYLARQDRAAAAVDRRPLKVHVRGPGGELRGLEFVRASSPEGWHHSRTNTLTMAVPAVGPGAGGVSAALLFRLSGTKSTLCVALSIHPAERIARAGLVLGPDTLPEGEALNAMLRRIAGSAHVTAAGDAAEVVIGEEKVTVGVGAGPASSVIQVTLGRRRRYGLKSPIRERG